MHVHGASAFMDSFLFQYLHLGAHLSVHLPGDAFVTILSASIDGTLFAAEICPSFQSDYST